MPWISKEKFTELHIAGTKMSNWLYNQCQHDYFKKYSADMESMVKEWDEAVWRIRATGKESK